MARDSVKPAQYFEYKQGVGEFPAQGWGGMQLDGDPGTMPRNGVALALNMRLDAGNWRSRYGLKEIARLPYAFATTGPGSITWLGMHHLQYNPPKLWLASYGCFGVGTEPGAFLEWHNPDKTPSTQMVANFISEGDRVPVIASYSGNMLFGDWGLLHRPTVLEPLVGERVNISFRQSYSDQIAGFSGYEATAMQEFDAKLFIALRDPAGAASKVGWWDGVTMNTSDLSTTTTHGLNFCVWRDSKLVMTQSGSANLRIRNLAGTWATVALPNAISEVAKNTMVEFRDKIYIADGQYIYVLSNFDSPSAATAQTLAANHVCTSVATLSDNLYYLHNDKGTSPPYAVWIGAYEPDLGAANWNDSFKRIDTDMSGTAIGYAPGGATMTTYRNRLYVGGAYSTLGTHTTPMDPLSTWWIVREGGLAKQYIASMRVGG